ncbi:MAG: leucine-rich repeat protein [Lachnospiraceae bacterium]|nr:leucine-rich repeat protein [Lachnospiraceae bacterium]
MKYSRRILRNFLACLLISVLCFSAALTAFAEEAASETPTSEIPISETPAPEAANQEESSAETVSASETGGSGELDAGIAEAVEIIRSEYGDEAAESFKMMLNNAGMKAFMTALQQKLEAGFEGMTGDEITEKLENMSEEEALALMERIFSDPEMEALAEAVSEDEALAEEMETFMTILFGDAGGAGSGDIPKLEKTVSGTQGDNISWTLDTDGTLTISGSGGITPSYEEFEGIGLPFYGWDDYIDNIDKIVIKDGITDITEDAFSWSSTLKTVVIPASVKSIGSAAFAGCENLTAVYFQGDAPEIAEDAFEGCSENLKLYYREGTGGWDQVTGYSLAVWSAASSGESSEESQTTVGTQSSASQETSSAAADSSTKGTPHTGDTGNVWPFIILMAAAVICGAAVVIMMRRKK